ncbi:MAG: hypothetical protein AAF519_09065 [Bacteroidota bacterium]
MEAISKVTMNMTSKTLDDVAAISKMIGTTNRTTIVAMALRAYKRLLELQEKEKNTFLAESPNGVKTKFELIH